MLANVNSLSETLNAFCVKLVLLIHYNSFQGVKKCVHIYEEEKQRDNRHRAEFILIHYVFSRRSITTTAIMTVY